MINDLESNLPIYKFVDDCTVYEVLLRSANAALQTNIDGTSEWIHNNNMLLNVKITKELHILFTKCPLDLQNLSSANSEIKVVDEFKLLGITTSSDLSWNSHINDICSKANLTRKFDIYKCRTEGFERSFIPSCVNTWDNLVI